MDTPELGGTARAAIQSVREHEEWEAINQAFSLAEKAGKHIRQAPIADADKIVTAICFGASLLADAINDLHETVKHMG